MLLAWFAVSLWKMSLSDFNDLYAALIPYRQDISRLYHESWTFTAKMGKDIQKVLASWVPGYPPVELAKEDLRDALREIDRRMIKETLAQ